MKVKEMHAVKWLVILGTAFVLLSGCDLLVGSEEAAEESTGGSDAPTETAIGFYDGFVSGSSVDWVGLVPLTAGVQYRVSLTGLSANVTFVVRDGSPSNIGVTVVGSSENNGSSSTSITFTAAQSSYVAGIQLDSGSTSYSLTTYEIK
jgi:hypothetical protein